MVSKNVTVKAEALKKSLNTLDRAIKKTTAIVSQMGAEEFDEVASLALVKSLEMAIESLWKFIRIMLQEIHGVDAVASPKGVINQALTLSLISTAEFKQLISIIDKRNLMAHTYSQTDAHAVTQKIPEYADFLKIIAHRLLNSIEF